MSPTAKKTSSELDYSVVVPVYNEAGNIQDLYLRTSAVLDKLSKKWEIIFVNDGSRDQSLRIIKNLVSQDSRVKLISLSRNFGHQGALTAGLDHAKGKAIISIDADLQDPPELISEMIKKWKEGNEVVYARRKNYRNDSIIKKTGSVIYYKLLDKFSDVKMPRNVGDFRLISRRVMDELKKMDEKNVYLRGSVAWLGFKHDFVEYQRKDRQNGKSGYTLRKLVNLGMEGFLNFTTIPFKLGLMLGLASMFFGFLFLIYMVWDNLINHVRYELFKFLVVILFIFMGFMFMLFWILGEYLWRVYGQVRHKASYIIAETY